METDFIIIGSGLAGLTSALVLKDFGKVLVITKGKLADGSTNLAQGGIAAVVEEGDSFASHIKDTLIAGADHNNKKAVEYLVKNAPKAINWLENEGVKFAKIDGRFSPTREAAHSFPRVLHSTDITGREIEKALLKRIKEEKNITVWENCFASGLLVKNNKCCGVKCHCGDGSNEAIPLQSDKKNSLTVGSGDRHAPPMAGLAMTSVYSRLVILATGGLGQLYEWTTNPSVSTGDGIALAYRAGAKLKDLEFVQFHPTALKPACRQAGYGRSPLFLLSEALRGEGGYLVKIKNQKSKIKDTNQKLKIKNTAEKFMRNYDERGDLASRDIVARAIFNEQQKGYEVYLDIRHKGKDFLIKRFPNIYRELKKRGFDLAEDLIPVTCAAHYSCGGVEVDLYGRTSVKNLFAFGEVACTGVHGANRLASNSLLEAVVFPLRLREQMSLRARRRSNPMNQQEAYYQPYFDGKGIATSSQHYAGTPRNDIKTRLQHLMWEKAGIVRTQIGLKEAIEEIDKLDSELTIIASRQTKQSQPINQSLPETQNMILVAKLIIQSALKRKSSLGAHFIVSRYV